jgi:hypothetical protein
MGNVTDIVFCLQGYDNLPRSEYAVVVLIVVTVASQGYLAGVVAGILGAAVVFVSDYSRVPIVRARLQVGGRGGIRSSAARTRSEVEVIARLGGGVYGAKLQGYLFFATAYRLLEEIKARHERVKADGSPLTYVILDFVNVVGVDGSAISVFEKLRRFCAREKITVLLSDVDRAELARVVGITLFGEDRPTFAFIDRVDVLEQSKQIFRVPQLEDLYDESGQYYGEVLATCDSGRVVQARDLDAALRFVENSMIARKDELEDWGRKGVDGNVNQVDGAFELEVTFDDSESLLDTDEVGTSWTSFEGMVNAVCDGDASFETVFRNAWRPVTFNAGDVVSERGEIADRIFWVEDATLRLDMSRGKMSETVDEDVETDIDRTGDGSSSDVELGGETFGETFGERAIASGSQPKSSTENSSVKRDVLYRFGEGSDEDGVVIETLDVTTEDKDPKDAGGSKKSRQKVKDVAVKTGAAAGAGGLLASAAATAVNMSTAAKAATAAAAAASAAGAAMTGGVDPGTAIAAAGAAAEVTQLAGTVAQTTAAAAPAAANVAAAASTAINAAAAAAGGAGIGGAIGGFSSTVLKGKDDSSSSSVGSSADGSDGTRMGSGSFDEDDALTAAGPEETPGTSRGFNMSVTSDFIGAVGFYRRGGVGQVRFGRIVVEKGGSGYVLELATMDRLERENPALAMRLHKVMAGTLANQVISRNKLITQYIR